MMLCVDTVVPEHFEMFFGDMHDKASDEIKGGNAFPDGLIIFVPCVMKSYIFPIVFINAGGSNDGTAEVAADVFKGDIRRAGIGFSTDIEAFRMIFIDIIPDFAERRADRSSHFFKEDFAESIAEKSIVKVFYGTPGSDITSGAFRDKDMNVRIPFQIPSEGMQDTDKTRREIFGCIDLREHAEDNIPDRGK